MEGTDHAIACEAGGDSPHLHHYKKDPPYGGPFCNAQKEMKGEPNPKRAETLRKRACVLVFRFQREGGTTERLACIAGGDSPRRHGLYIVRGDFI
jgi:hypothetical protein